MTPRVVFIDMEGHSILAEVGAPIAQASVRSSACNKRIFLAVLLLSGHVRFYNDIRLTSLKMRSLLHVRQQLSDLLDFSSSGVPACLPVLPRLIHGLQVREMWSKKSRRHSTRTGTGEPCTSTSSGFKAPQQEEKDDPRSLPTPLSSCILILV